MEVHGILFTILCRFGNFQNKKLVGKSKAIVLLYSNLKIILKLLDSTLSESVGLPTKCFFSIPF